MNSARETSGSKKKRSACWVSTTTRPTVVAMDKAPLANRPVFISASSGLRRLGNGLVDVSSGVWGVIERLDSESDQGRVAGNPATRLLVPGRRAYLTKSQYAFKASMPACMSASGAGKYPTSPMSRLTLFR